MKIECIRAGKSKYLTDNKEYEVIKEDFNDYYIINNNNIYQNYKKNRFRIILNSK